MSIFSGRKDGSATAEPKLSPALPPIDKGFWKDVGGDAIDLWKSNRWSEGGPAVIQVVLLAHVADQLVGISANLDRIATALETRPTQ